MIVFATIYKLQAKDAPWRYAVKCDYNAELVEALKKNIPSRQRKWCPDIRQWWFKEEVIDDVLVLLDHYCSNVHHSNGRAYGNAAIPPDLGRGLSHLVSCAIRARGAGQGCLPYPEQDFIIPTPAAHRRYAAVE